MKHDPDGRVFLWVALVCATLILATMYFVALTPLADSP